MAVTNPETSYPALFSQLVVRNAAVLCQQWRAEGETTPRLTHSAQERGQLLHALQSTLRLPALWSTARELLLLLLLPMERAGHRRDWIPLLEECLRLSQERDDAESAGEVSYRLGVLHQLLGEYKHAQPYLQESAELFSALDNSRQARSLNALAYGARLQGEPAVAENFAQQALIAAQGEGKRVAATYTVLGCLAYDRRDWSSAEDYWQRSLDLWRTGGDRAMVAMRLRDLGTALYEQKEYTRASVYLEEALSLSLADGDIWNVAISHMNLGNVCLSSQRPEAALALYRQAETTFRALYDYRHLAMCYNNRGIACRELGNWSGAETAYHAAVAQWRRVGEILLLADTLIDLAKLYGSQGCHPQTWAALRKALHLLGDRDHPAYNYQRKKALAYQAEVSEQMGDPSQTQGLHRSERYDLLHRTDKEDDGNC